MTDKKFTDEGIIRNYEWCIGCASDRCRECTMDEEGFCEEELQDLVLDLINRQKAENDCAKAKIKICAEVIDRQDKEIEWLKKRISGQKHALFKQQEYTAELQNSLETKCDDCNNIQLTHAEHGEVIKQVKSEAYKEFAEKAAIALANAYRTEYAHWIDDTLNNLLEELADTKH